MTSSSPTDRRAASRRPTQSNGGRGADLAHLLHCAVREAVQGLHAVSAAVGGSPPSLFTFPGCVGQEGLDAPSGALASGRTVALPDPNPADPGQKHVPPYPHISLSAPVAAAERRFGVITTLRLETHGDYQAADHTELQDNGRGPLIVDALGGVWYGSPNGRGKTVSLDLPIDVPEEEAIGGPDPKGGL